MERFTLPNYGRLVGCTLRFINWILVQLLSHSPVPLPNFDTQFPDRVHYDDLIGLEPARFTQLKRHTRSGDFVMFCYRVKDQCFILLPCHFLYSKSGGHKILCSGVKFKSCFNVVKNYKIPTDSSCYTDSEKWIVWPIYTRYHFRCVATGCCQIELPYSDASIGPANFQGGQDTFA